MFYQKIEQEIGKRKINLNQLAKGAGIPQSGTSRWKKGTMPSCEALIKICQYLNISADYLLDLDETPPPPTLTDEEKDLLDHFRQCDPCQVNADNSRHINIVGFIQKLLYKLRTTFSNCHGSQCPVTGMGV